ncbi:MAG: NADH-quinone oxidoreductase subunit K [Elusimicrobiota bacterium]|jgi:hydrogenase-4 component E
MNFWLDALIVLVILANLRVLGASRLDACIKTVAFQGALLGLLPVLAHLDSLNARLLFQAGISTFLKAAVFPWLLGKALREAGLQREVEPFVGFTTSLAAGVLFLGAALWIGVRLPLTDSKAAAALAPAALFTIFVGLFIMVSRRKALSQVLGYLILENGIYAFGMAFAEKQPLLVELGILLDVFMAVFVMGIAIYHISREFDHLDADRMSTLKD